MDFVLTRGDLRFRIADTSLKRIAKVSDQRLTAIADSVYTGAIDGQPVVVYEPGLAGASHGAAADTSRAVNTLQAANAPQAADTFKASRAPSSRAPNLVAVIGYDGLMLVGLAADGLDPLDQDGGRPGELLDTSVFLSGE